MGRVTGQIIVDIRTNSPDDQALAFFFLNTTDLYQAS